MDRESKRLSAFLAGPAFLYEHAARLRAALYAAGALRSHRLGRPVISVGNLTVGGTGKTPLVIHLARLLHAWGHVPVVLSRGYRRRYGCRTLTVPPGPHEIDFQEIGDEPALIRRRVPQVWLGISADRHRAACAILRRNPRPVFILDDGFQHLALRRDLDIVLIDCLQPLIGNRALPCGSLRESPDSLRRAAAVILKNCGEPQPRQSMETAVRTVHPEVRLFHGREHLARIVDWDTWVAGSEAPDMSGRLRTVYLVSAVANPDRFRSDVLARDLQSCGEARFRDHHVLSEAEWSSCERGAIDAGADAILITEKDAVKIRRRPAFPLAVAVQQTAIEETLDFEEMIRVVCPQRMLGG